MGLAQQPRRYTSAAGLRIPGAVLVMSLRQIAQKFPIAKARCPQLGLGQRIKRPHLTHQVASAIDIPSHLGSIHSYSSGRMVLHTLTFVAASAADGELGATSVTGGCAFTGLVTFFSMASSNTLN